MITLTKGQYLSDIMNEIPSDCICNYLGTKHGQELNYHSSECPRDPQQVQ